MVSEEALKNTEIPLPVEPTDLPEEELRWCSVTLNEVLQHNCRLEASIFGVESRQAREVLKRCKWPSVPLCGEHGLCTSYRPPLYKRIWSEVGINYYLPSQATHIKPEPERRLSSISHVDIEKNKAKRGEMLLTCSGTIGNCAYVSRTLDGLLFSQNIIHIEAVQDDTIGYVYAFLKSKIGQAILKSNEYGAVIQHIDPEHLKNVLIPDAPSVIKKRIHDLVMKSYTLRDESNDLLNKAETLLYDALKLPPIVNLKPSYFDPSVEFQNYSVNLSQLEGRLDASYHVPVVDAILERMKKEAAEITTIGDSRISKRIILPGRFARVYVQEGQGTVFFGGKQINELDPSNKKYLSLKHHGKRIRKELTLEENMILITRSGTIGKVALVPAHWENWVANEHIIRVEPVRINIAGYLYVFLATEYGRELITRFTYGAVVDEIDDRHVAQIPIPLLKDQKIQTEINLLALEANAKRTKAYHTEQEAVRIINNEVIHTSENDQAI